METDNNKDMETVDDIYDEDGNLKGTERNDPHPLETPQVDADDSTMGENRKFHGREDAHPLEDAPVGDSQTASAGEVETDKRTLQVLQEETPLEEHSGEQGQGGATAIAYPGDESYFDDDEEFLRGDARVLLSEKDTAILEQLENVVTWEVDNFYNEEGKQRNRLSLRTDPPVFRIKSSDGDGAEFVLTKELAGEMERIMGDVYRGYFGISAKDNKKKSLNQESARGYLDKVKNEAKENPVRFSVITIFILACIFYLVMGSI